MKNLFLLLFLVCLSTSIYSQDEVIPKTESELQWDEISAQVESAFYAGNYLESAQLARQAYTFALENFDKDHLLIGSSLDNLGTVLHHAGKPEEALPFLEEAVIKAEQQLGKEHLDYISRANNLAMLYKDVGAFHKAIPLFIETLETTNIHHGKEHPSYAVLLNNQSILFQVMGLYDKALENALESLQLTEKILGKEHRKYGIRLTSLGSIYLRTGNPEKALPFLIEGLEVTEISRGKDHPSVAKVLRTLSNAYLSDGQAEAAIPHLERALAIEEKRIGSEHRHYLLSEYSLALAHRQLGHHKIALELFKDIVAKKERSKTDNLRFMVSPYLNLAIQYDLLGDTNNSLEMYEKVLENRQKIRQYYPFFSEEEQLAMSKKSVQNNDFVQSFALNNLEQQYFVDLSFDNIITTKEMSLHYTRQMLNTVRKQTDPSIKKLLQDWLGLKQMIAQEYVGANSATFTKIDSLENKCNELESQLARNAVDFKNISNAIHWQDIQNELQDGEIAIEFSHFNYYEDFADLDSTIYVAYILKKGNEHVKLIPLCSEKELGNLRNTRSLYAFEKREGFPNLHELIFKPIEEELKNIHTIFYASSGVLHRINLSAIPIDINTIFAEQFSMHKISSSRQILENNITTLDREKSALLYGGIKYDQEEPTQANDTYSADNTYMGNAFRSLREDDWAYLSWTEKEVNQAEEVLLNAGFETILKKGENATEDYIKLMDAKETSPKILHFATHAYFFPTNENKAFEATPFESSRHAMIRSGLILAGANTAWNGETLPSGEDGVLTAYEIAQMDLSNTELVILSACETGLGDINDSEGVFGLQRAFKTAGVKHIIMSLWSVKDKQTHEFMSNFYQLWLNPNNKKTIPEAFQQAQLNLKKQYTKPFNPFLWAGFILME